MLNQIDEEFVFIHLICSIPDENRNTDRINCCYQISNGILIRDFAINFLQVNPLCVKVFAFGNKQFYDKYIHSNNKSYYQVDKNNIFQFDIDSSQFDFDYFTDFTVALSEIEQIILDYEYSTIVLFLDDHGNEGLFSQIGYFQLYKMLLKFPNNDFLIFNDSCYSGRMIDLIKSYNQIHESNIFKYIPKDIGGQVLFSFLNLFNLILDSKKENNPIEEAERLINSYQKIKMINDVSSIKNLNLNDETDTVFKEIYNLIGLNNEQDIADFRFVFDSFETLKNKHDLLTKYIKSKETFNVHNFKVIIKYINNNLQNFIDTLSILYEDRQIIDFNLLPHQNIEIITSTDSKNVCFSYTSIRINEVTKGNPGSPAMSAFIKEIFLKIDNSPFSFDNIKKEMTEYNDMPISYQTNPDISITNQHKKRKCISLYPQHYKENSQKIYSFIRDKDVNLKVAALRTISFLINQKLLLIAKSLAPEIDSNNLNSYNDPLADIVAISAILYKCNEAIPIVRKHIVINNIFLKHNSVGINTISSIYKYAFTFSKEPINMTAVILNCLQKAVNCVIYDIMISIRENKKDEKIYNNLLSDEEITLLMKCYTNKSINDEISLIRIFSPVEEEDKKYEFLNDIANATFSLINSSSILPAFVISSLFTGEFKEEYIQKVKFLEQFCQDEIFKTKDEKITKIKEYSERILYSEIKTSLLHLDIICDAYIKNDAMRIVTQKLQFYSSLFLMNILAEYLGDSENQIFTEFIINCIESKISNRNISTFLIPLILSLVDEKVIIYGLYASISKTKSNCYQEVFDILNGIKNKLNERKYNDLIQLSENLLSDVKNITNKLIIEKKVIQMKNEISKEIENSINQVMKIINLSIKKARGNISKKMNINIIKDQINQYDFYLKYIEKDKYHNKYHMYLYSSIAILEEAYNNYTKAPSCTKIVSKGFNISDSIINTKALYERAANELFTVAYLFNISDKPINEDNLNKFNSNSIISFAASVMAARYFNIVEMAPIVDVLGNYISLFEISDGDEPNIKELMGLHAANILILSLKDKKRKRFRIQNKNDNKNKDKDKNEEEEDKDKNDESEDKNEKKNEDEIEYDSYYSNSYDEETDEISYRSYQLDLSEEISFYNKSHKIIIQPKILSHKDQIGGTEIKSIQKELNLGHGDWTYEAWIAFVYCFNKRMSHINIKFDPENDYSDAKYPITIGEVLLVIEKFYPIYRIRYFWKNEQRIKRFVGKYSNYRYQILKALIRSFDDTDRIVTPLHMFQETYEVRTQEKLNLIFDY